MRIVELYGHFIWKGVEMDMAFVVTTDDVLNRGGALKVFLFQAQLFSLKDIVIGVKNF